MTEDWDYTAGNTDTVQFTDVKATDISAVEQQGNDLLLRYGATDAVRVSYQFYDKATRIEQFKFADGVTWGLSDIASRLQGTASDDALTGMAGFSNRLAALGGNDRVTGQELNDTLIGGRGDDALLGGVGNDTYVFAKGDGTDRIEDWDYTAGNTDTVQFTDVKATDSIVFEESGIDLVVRFGTTDSVRIVSHFSNSEARIEQFKFADGVVVDANKVVLSLSSSGTASNDTLNGRTGKFNRLFGLAGNDVLNGADLADTLDGGAGADTLIGGAGNDTYVVDNIADVVIEKASQGTDTVNASVTHTLAANVDNLNLKGTAAINGTGNALNNIINGNAAANTLIGGAGNDTLNGGAGNDTYLFGRGNGADVITDTDATKKNADVLKFGAGIAADQLWFSRAGSDLAVSVIGTNDKVSVKGWFASTNNQIEKLQVAKGQALLNTQVLNLVNAMAAFAPPAFGQTTLSAKASAALQPVIAANWK